MPTLFRDYKQWKRTISTNKNTIAITNLHKIASIIIELMQSVEGAEFVQNLSDRSGTYRVRNKLDEAR